MPNITITLSDAEFKSLEYVAADPSDWAVNAVTERARLATNDIVQIYTQRALDESVSIPSTRDEIIMDAFARGWVKTSAQRALDAQNEAEALLNGGA